MYSEEVTVANSVSVKQSGFKVSFQKHPPVTNKYTSTVGQAFIIAQSACTKTIVLIQLDCWHIQTQDQQLTDLTYETTNTSHPQVEENTKQSEEL